MLGRRPGRERHRPPGRWRVQWPASAGRCSPAPSTATSGPSAWRGPGPPCCCSTASATTRATWDPVLEPSPATSPSSRPTCSATAGPTSPAADYGIGAYANGMRDLLSVLDIERVTVVGHSLGGGVAMQFAYQFPERSERLILVGAGGLGRERDTRSCGPRRCRWPTVLLPMRRWPRRPLRRPSWSCGCSQPLVTGLGRDTDYLVRLVDGLSDATAAQRVPADPARGRRLARAGRDDARPLLPGGGHADAAHLGRRDTIIPVEHGRTRATRRCPRAGSRCSSAPGTSRSTPTRNAS